MQVVVQELCRLVSPAAVQCAVERDAGLFDADGWVEVSVHGGDLICFQVQSIDTGFRACPCVPESKDKCRTG